MGLFSRNKKSKNTEKDDENPDWNKDLKRNIINKTGVNQQGFNFLEKINVCLYNFGSSIKICLFCILIS